MKINLHEIEPPEGMQKEMCADLGIPDDWIYRDTQRATKEAWETMLNTVGEENYRLITKAQYPDSKHGFLYRGQMFISPNGMQNLRDYAEKVYKDNA